MMQRVPLRHSPTAKAATSAYDETDRVLADLRAHTKLLPAMSREQIAAMFVDLPHDAEGRVAFADLQRRVMQAREQRVRVLAQTFPDVLRRKLSPSALNRTIRPPSPPRLRLRESSGTGYRSATARSGGGGGAGHAPLSSPATTGAMKLSRLQERRLSETLMHRYSHITTDRSGLHGDAASKLAASLRTIRTDTGSALPR